MIAIVDYGMGNLRSVQKALEHVGAQADIVETPEAIARADKVVLPGVGAFRDAAAQLRKQGLIEPVLEAIGSGRPFLGICLGLQLLFDVSYEDGEQTGLGVFGGAVRRFAFNGQRDGPRLKVPHMGWNQIEWTEPCRLLEGVPQDAYFYFVHSYYVDPTDADLARARCDYGSPFTAMVWRDNVFATQFHPEKSQQTGLKMLHNFVAL